MSSNISHNTDDKAIITTVVSDILIQYKSHVIIATISSNINNINDTIAINLAPLANLIANCLLSKLSMLFTKDKL